jgi:4-amino-4-deoxy-L-arabinose transferase-like glycosyltransferase
MSDVTLTQPQPTDARVDAAGAGGRRLGNAAALAPVLVIVAVAWAVLQLFALDLTPFHTKGEPREAVVVQDLVRNGNWILPRRNNVQLPRKPPLFYWLAGAAAHARGAVDEASVRLPSAVLSGLAALLLAGVATVLYGGTAGVLAGLSLLTSFEWLRAATAARVDMTLSFGLALVFVGLLMFRRSGRGVWLVVFYAGAVWATLSKGIPGLVIPALQVVLLCLVDRSLAFARRVRPLTGLLAVVLVAGAWYAAAVAEGGRDFVRIVVSENVVRAVGERDFTLGHRHSVGYLFGALAAGLLPWTVLLPGVGAAVWRVRRTLERSDPRLFALVWIVAVFAPYAIATSKRGVYLLPLYPAVSLLIGWWAAELVAGRVATRWLPGMLAALGWLLGLALALLAVAAAAQAVGVPILDSAALFLDARAARDVGRVAAAIGGPAQLAICLAVGAAAATGMASAASLRNWGLALACMIVCTASVIVGVRTVILPAIAANSTRMQFAAALRRAAVDPAAVHTQGLDYGTLFYWGADMPAHDRNSGAAPPYLLLPEPDWLRMSRAERRRYRRVPGLAIERGNNQGYVVVLERSATADTE